MNREGSFLKWLLAKSPILVPALQLDHEREPNIDRSSLQTTTPRTIQKDREKVILVVDDPLL